MRKRQWAGLAALLGVLALTAPALSQKIVQKPALKKMTLQGRVMDYSKLKDKETKKFLDAIGPAVRDLLAARGQVEVPGLGTFRIVNVPPHRDMVSGRPATIAGVNYVEFLPSADVAAVANAPGATAAESVTPFQYVPIPGRDPGAKAPNSRAPNVRTR